MPDFFLYMYNLPDPLVSYITWKCVLCWVNLIILLARLCDSFFSYAPETEICYLLQPSKTQPFNIRSCNLFAVIYLLSLDNQHKWLPSCISTVLSRTMIKTGPYADVLMPPGSNIRTWAGPLNTVYLPRKWRIWWCATLLNLRQVSGFWSGNFPNEKSKSSAPCQQQQHWTVYASCASEYVRIIVDWHISTQVNRSVTHPDHSTSKLNARKQVIIFCLLHIPAVRIIPRAY